MMMIERGAEPLGRSTVEVENRCNHLDWGPPSKQ